MPEQRRRLRVLPRFLLGAILVVLCTTAGVAAIAIGQISTLASDIGLHAVGSKFLQKAPPSGAQTILVIGDDHSGPYDAACQCHLLHADTFMLVHMDPNQGQTSIMSIPRDLMVNFTWHGVSWTDQKFNSAYSIGEGPNRSVPLADQLVLKVVRQYFPGMAINHYIDINFDAFIGVVRAIGCVYVDVDHRYLNATDQTYSKIDLEPGYQKLCAGSALSYVRYRHTDSDFVRVARQQDFIRQAKEQLGLFNLLGKLDSIAKAFGEAITTDISGVKTVNNLLQLVAFSQSRPIRSVPFKSSNTAYQVVTSSGTVEDYVTSTPALIKQSVDSFLYENPAVPTPETHGPATTSQHTHAQHHHAAGTGSTTSGAHDLFALTANNQPAALQLAPSVPFPVLLPRFETGEATANDPEGPNDARAYTIADESGHVYHGYRVDWQQNVGGYYGIEGTNWLNPPLFANPSATLTIHGRTFMFIDDGSHWHDIGWRSGNALYWVSNTLLEDLSNAQMLALAESAQPLSALGGTG